MLWWLKETFLFYIRLNICKTYFLLLFDKIPCRLCIFCSCTSRDLSLTFCNRSIIASKNGMYFCISANFLSYSSISLVVYCSPVPREENLYTYKYLSIIKHCIICFFYIFLLIYKLYFLHVILWFLFFLFHFSNIYFNTQNYSSLKFHNNNSKIYIT